MFQTSKEGIEGSERAPQITNPFLGDARLTKIELRDIESKKGEEFNDVLAFTFTLKGEDVTGEDVTGRVMEKLEWPPGDDDSAKKTENKVNRVGYILKYFIGRERASNISGENWSEFAKAAYNAIKDEEYSKVPIRIKVVANMYNEPSVEIPNYLGFIEGEESKHPIAFTASEERDNAKYLKSKSADADSVDDLDIDDDEFTEDDSPF